MLRNRYYELSFTRETIAIRGEPLDNTSKTDRPDDFPKYVAKGTFLGKGFVCRILSKTFGLIWRLIPGTDSSLGLRWPRREHVQLLRYF